MKKKKGIKKYKITKEENIANKTRSERNTMSKTLFAEIKCIKKRINILNLFFLSSFYIHMFLFSCSFSVDREQDLSINRTFFESTKSFFKGKKRNHFRVLSIFIFFTVDRVSCSFSLSQHFVSRFSSFAFYLVVHSFFGAPRGEFRIRSDQWFSVMNRWRQQQQRQQHR